MLANYNRVLPKTAVHATTRGRCCSESSFSSFYWQSIWKRSKISGYDL